MNFINPVGRPVNGGVKPQACMCHKGFASSRGSESGITGCLHCGCGCGSSGEYHTGNKQDAMATIRCS